MDWTRFAIESSNVLLSLGHRSSWKFWLGRLYETFLKLGMYYPQKLCIVRKIVDVRQTQKKCKRDSWGIQFTVWSFSKTLCLQSSRQFINRCNKLLSMPYVLYGRVWETSRNINLTIYVNLFFKIDSKSSLIVSVVGFS